MTSLKRLLHTGPLRPAAAYGLATAASAVCFAVRFALSPALGTDSPFITFLLGVIVAAWFGGLAPGLFATGLSAAAGVFMFVEPVGGFVPATAAGAVQLAQFVVLGAVASWLGSRGRKATDLLAEERERLAVTLGSIGDAVVATDAAGRVTFLNAEAERLTDWPQAEAAGRPLDEVFRIVDEDARRPAESPVRRVMATGRVVGLANHTVLVSRDGTERPIDDSAAPIKDRRGNLVGVVLVFRDVSERRSAERAVTESRRQLSLALKAGRSGTFHWDAATNANVWSEELLALYGLRPEEFGGRYEDWLACLLPEDRDAGAAAVACSLETGEFATEFRIRRRDDGEVRWMDGRGQVLFGDDGKPAGMVGINIDVTERKRSEERSNFLLRFDDALRPLADPEEVTRTAARLLGEFLGADRCAYADVEADEDTFNLTGDYCRGVPSIVGRYKLSAFGSEVLRLHRADEPFVVDDVEARLPPEDLEPYGRTQIRAVISVPLHKGGRFVAGMAVHQAVPRRWRRDEVELVRAVASRSWESIERARVLRELREADGRKDQFLATLAHELRNPLAPVSNALQAWPLVEHDPAEAERLREMMGRQVSQMVRLIDDLLDVSRITRGRVELRKERLDLATVLEGATEAVRPFLEAHRHELTVVLPARPVALQGDVGRLMQVFGNLLNNAAKYTAPGGHVWVTAMRGDDSAVVSVRDDGSGIPPEMLTEIFDMFVQADQTLDRSHGGLGIGLTLVRSLVELHGGTVEAKSEGPGRGSEFIVRLPAEPEGVADDAPVGATFRRTLPPPARRVLVVDDVKPSANTLAMMLKGLGQEARTAYDGLSALAVVEEFGPEAAFLDIAMPGMDGYELARRIRVMNGYRPVLVALTGYGQEEDRRRAIEAGFDHHLVKPTSVDALRQILVSVPPS